MDTGSVLELVQAFADTWFSLDAYDRDTLVSEGATKQEVIITAKELKNVLLEFRDALMQKSEASDLFGREREKGSVASIIGNVLQSFDGADVYKTIEEKRHIFCILWSKIIHLRMEINEVVHMLLYGFSIVQVYSIGLVLHHLH